LFNIDGHLTTTKKGRFKSFWFR